MIEVKTAELIGPALDEIVQAGLDALRQHDYHPFVRSPRTWPRHAGDCGARGFLWAQRKPIIRPLTSRARYSAPVSLCRHCSAC